MSIRKVNFAEGEYYHIYNRGNSKQVIYKSAGDHERFQKLLYLANSEMQFRIYNGNNVFEIERGDVFVSIGAYCLMPNHFHILLTPKIEGGVSKFLQKLTTGYSMYFNNLYDRTGTLYEGKFKSRWVDTDMYLKYLFAYIHLNPVKLIDPHWKDGGIKNVTQSLDFATSFRWSSLSDWLGVRRPENAIVDTTAFPAYFNTAKYLENDLIEWLSYESKVETEVVEKR